MKTLLIVEHDKRDRQALYAMVQRSQIRIDTILECNNGEDAIYILQNQKIDVMFTSIRMQNMDGIELIEKIRLYPNAPKIVVVSDSDEFTHAVKLMRLGVRDYLLKPIQSKQIEEILQILDSELITQQEIQEARNTVNAQHLKQILLSSTALSKDIESMMRQSDCTLFQEPYVVCCLDNMGGHSYITENRGYIANVEQGEIFIVKELLVNKVRLQEWRRRFVGVSNAYVGIEQLRMAYDEAYKARIEAFYREKSMVKMNELVESDVEKRDKEKDKNLSVEMMHLVNILATSKASQVIKTIRTFIWENRRERDLVALQEVVSLFFENVEATYPAVSVEEIYEIQNLKSPLSYSTIEVYEHSLINWLEQFIEQVQNQLSDFKSKQKMQAAIEYIKENYNKDFNMAVVSNEVSMNYSLFSLSFKQYTGTNFVNYLKQIRMEKAKEYLQNSDMRIGEISQNIGYENEKHFMKIFKTLYGVSPTEYRKSLQLKK